MKWTKKPHPVWADVKGVEGLTILAKLMPQHQWRSGDYSIISPSEISSGTYELFDGGETYRFDSLKEAQIKAEELNQSYH